MTIEKCFWKDRIENDKLMEAVMHQNMHERKDEPCLACKGYDLQCVSYVPMSYGTKEKTK